MSVARCLKEWLLTPPGLETVAESGYVSLASQRIFIQVLASISIAILKVIWIGLAKEPAQFFFPDII